MITGEMFHILAPVLDAAKDRGIELRAIPDLGSDFAREVVVATPPGHYLQINDRAAQIIAVDRARERSIYEGLIPGYKLTAFAAMVVPDEPEMAGRFVSLVYERDLASTQAA